MLIARVGRERNRDALSVLLRQAASYGQWVVGPASLIVLLSGLAMVGSARIGFGTFWVVWGFGGVLVHLLFGAFVLRMRGANLARLVSAGGADDGAVAAAARGLWQMQLLYLILLASVVAMMVLKPTL